MRSDPMTPADAEALARTLMDLHGLTAWEFAFSRSKRLLGRCVYPEDGRPGRIVLSKPYVEHNDEASVRDSVLHEIAHAHTPGDVHGELWKAKCRELGADPERVKHDFVRPPGRFRSVC